MDLIQEFKNGRIGILLDKENHDEIDNVINIIYPVVIGLDVAIGYTVDEYMHQKDSGPIHFVDTVANCLNGASIEYFKSGVPIEYFKNSKIIMQASDFIEEYNNSAKETEIDDEFEKIING